MSFRFSEVIPLIVKTTDNRRQITEKQPVGELFTLILLWFPAGVNER
jgi:hypothetical protein